MLRSSLRTRSSFRSPRFVAVAALALATAAPLVACSVSLGEDGSPSPNPISTSTSDGGSGVDGSTLVDGGGGDAATHGLHLSIVGESALVVVPGQKAFLSVRVDRVGVTGPVTLKATGLGATYSGKEMTLAPSESIATFEITATSTATADVSAMLEASDGQNTARAAFSVSAGRGRIDTRFGAGGMRELDAGVNDLLSLPEGTMLLSMAGAVNNRVRNLRKLDSRGNDVASFGTAGIVNVDYPITPAGQPVELMFGEGKLARLPDGKFLYASSLSILNDAGSPALGVARLDANGALDTSYGTGGWAKVRFEGNVELRLTGIALQSDNSVILVGIALPDRLTAFPIKRSAAIAKVTAAGQPDATFGANGKVSTTWNGTYGDARGVDVIDGSTYVTGYGDAKQQFDRYDGHVAKLAANGSLDTTFGVGGTVRVGTGARSVLFTSTGKIWASLTGGSFTGQIAIYDPVTGALETSLGNQGYIGSTSGYANDMFQAKVDGKIYVAKGHYGPNRFEVVAYDETTGRETPTFGTSATAEFPKHTYNLSPVKLVRAPDGSLLLAGSTNNYTGLVGKLFP